MKVLVGKEKIATLPVHDATVISMSTNWLENGDLNFRIVIGVNQEESMEAFETLGIKSRLVALQFGDCWQIVSNFYGYSSAPPTLSDWDVSPDSELLKKLREHGLAGTTGLYQHDLEFSDGSKMNILAGEVSLEEFTA